MWGMGCRAAGGLRTSLCRGRALSTRQRVPPVEAALKPLAVQFPPLSVQFTFESFYIKPQPVNLPIPPVEGVIGRGVEPLRRRLIDDGADGAGTAVAHLSDQETEVHKGQGQSDGDHDTHAQQGSQVRHHALGDRFASALRRENRRQDYLQCNP